MTLTLWCPCLNPLSFFLCDTIPFKRTRHSSLLSSYTASVSQVFLVFDNHYNLHLPLFLPFSLSTPGPARATQFSNTDLHPSPTRAIRAIPLHSIQGACHRYDLIMTIGSISAGGCFPGFSSLKQSFFVSSFRTHCLEGKDSETLPLRARKIVALSDVL